MKQSAFRITGKAENDFKATEGVRIERTPLSVNLIDGRSLSVDCDPFGLTRAVLFTTACGATLRAEERIYCVIPGIEKTAFPGVENRMTPEEKMAVIYEMNTVSPPHRIAIRRTVAAALSRMDPYERNEALSANFSKRELAGAVIENFTCDELMSLAASISDAMENQAMEVIAAE